ncbi:MAG TPA: 5-oxoprolinase subunit PxpA [bacterium]|nr:5-oxoprolinase subunit PxpA [bacterium]
MSIDLNADLGEGASTDAALLQVITSANIACGGHAGDEMSMRQAVAAAIARGVGIGAHPSYPDREGFGRRAMSLSPRKLIETLAGQIRRLVMIAEQAGAAVAHVKAHGALYNVAVNSEDVAAAIGQAVRLVDPDLTAVALSGSKMASIFRDLGLRVAEEAFIDRGYTAAGTLVARSDPRALIIDPAVAAARALRMMQQGLVESVDGVAVRVRADTLCVHADTPGSPELAAATRRALESAGFAVLRMGA